MEVHGCRFSCLVPDLDPGLEQVFEQPVPEDVGDCESNVQASEMRQLAADLLQPFDKGGTCAHAALARPAQPFHQSAAISLQKTSGRLYPAAALTR